MDEEFAYCVEFISLSQRRIEKQNRKKKLLFVTYKTDQTKLYNILCEVII
jgi:hypothetical protein